MIEKIIILMCNIFVLHGEFCVEGSAADECADFLRKFNVSDLVQIFINKITKR